MIVHVLFSPMSHISNTYQATLLDAVLAYFRETKKIPTAGKPTSQWKFPRFARFSSNCLTKLWSNATEVCKPITSTKLISAQNAIGEDSTLAQWDGDWTVLFTAHPR